MTLLHQFAQIRRWWRPLLASYKRFCATGSTGGLPQHDTHDCASGNAVACPVASTVSDFAKKSAIEHRDVLTGDHLIGQIFLDSVPARAKAQPVHPPAINVETYILPSIYRAIAALKDIAVELLHENCSAHIDQALQQIPA